MRQHPHRHLGAREAGFTLIEVVAAMVVLGILSAVVLGIIIQTQRKSVDNRARIAAANLASREIDIVRDEFGRSKDAPKEIEAAGIVVNPHQLPGGTQGDPLVLDGKAYTVERSVQWNITGTGASACDGGSSVRYPTLSVTVSVTWPGMTATKPVVDTAQLAPDKGSSIPAATGWVVVKVVDSAGQPNEGRTVTVTGPGGANPVARFTDDTGCAVVPVNPSDADGEIYTATLGDPGYVDIAGNNRPAKTTGMVAQGVMSDVLNFAYDQSASLNVDVRDSAGNSVDPSTIGSASITVVAYESSGAGSSSAHLMSEMPIRGLWPTTYGAYFGTTVPPSYETTKIGPGATGTVTVTLQMAQASFDHVPPGTTGLAAVSGAATCPAVSSATLDPAGFTLVPGIWTFFAYGPNFDCAQGPTVELLSGDDGAQGWDATQIAPSTTTPPPAAGTLWAINATRWTAGSLKTCPDTATRGQYAINIDALRTGPVELPAGDWYLYRLDASATSCLGIVVNQYPLHLDYGHSTQVSWSETYTALSVKVTNENDQSLGGTYRIVAAQTTTLANGGNCNTTNVPTGAVAFTTSSSSSATGALTPGTWYLYLQKYSGSNKTCTIEPGTLARSLDGASSSYTVKWRTAGVTPS